SAKSRLAGSGRDRAVFGNAAPWRAKPYRIGPALPVGATLGDGLDVVLAVGARLKQEEPVRPRLYGHDAGARPPVQEAAAEGRVPAGARIKDAAEVAGRHEIAVRGYVLSANHDPHQEAGQRGRPQSGHPSQEIHNLR